MVVGYLGCFGVCVLLGLLFLYVLTVSKDKHQDSKFLEIKE